MKKTLFLFLFLLTTNLFSQFEKNIAYLPQGLSLPLLNGNGNSSIFNDVANISAMNPASLEYFKDISLGFSYQFETIIDESWIASIGSKRINNGLPQSIGFVFPIGSFNFALSMNQKYNRSLLIGPLEVTTITNPDGTGEFVEIVDETLINNYSFTAAHTLNNLFSDSELAIGFRIGMNNLDYYNKSQGSDSYVFSNYLESHITNTDISFGAIYTTTKVNNYYLKFGLFYQSDLQFIEIAKIHQIDSPNIETTLIYSFPTEIKVVAKYPANLRFDFEIKKTNNFIFLGSISNSFWRNITDNYKNQIELTCSISYLINKLNTLSFGVIYSEKKFVNDYFDANPEMDVIFLTAGAVIKFYDVNINLAVADSHLFSGDYRKQTIGKLSLSYSF